MRSIVIDKRLDKCTVSPDAEVYAFLYKNLAYKAKNYWFSTAFKNKKWDGYYRFFDAKAGRFSTGFLPVVESLIRTMVGVPVVVNDNTGYTYSYDLDKISIEGVELRDYQLRGIKALLAAGRGILGAATGAGKTLVSVAVVQAIDLPTLFLVRGKSLVEQTYDIYKKYCPNKRVTKCIAGDLVFGDITIASVDTLASGVKNHDLGLLQYLAQVHVLVVDECHTAAATTFKTVINKTFAPWRFGLSGTPLSRDDNKNMDIVALLGPVVSFIPVDELVEKDFLLATDVYMHTIESHDLWGSDYVFAVQNGIVNNDYRNSLIIEIASKAEEDSLKTMILVKEIAHGEIFSSALDAPFLSGKTKVAQRKILVDEFRAGDCPTIIASTIFDQGIDIPEIDVLIMAGVENL